MLVRTGIARQRRISPGRHRLLEGDGEPVYNGPSLTNGAFNTL